MQEQTMVQPPQSTDQGQSPVQPQPTSQNQPNQVSMPSNETRVYGSILERFIALIIDAIVLGIPTGIVIGIPANLILVFILLQFYTAADLRGNGTPEQIYTLFRNLISVISLGLVHAYFLSKNGQTPGKKMEHLQVVEDNSGKFLTFKQAFLRQTVGIFLDVLPLFAGILVAFQGPKHQAFHDRFVGSVVIKK